MQPIGQTLVKKTWNVQKIVTDSVRFYVDAKLNLNDSTWYRSTTISQLFIMYKEEKTNEMTKDGRMELLMLKIRVNQKFSVKATSVVA